ncbi:unnamed protein product [Rotaria sordida]|uniref:EF-hand domain-containing protein n=2 Tax=Rotaria sordida TaxID=392033 RepID=A0A818XYJ2_9BILA|nr:unnamed protein product [Rotaria sordida]
MLVGGSSRTHREQQTMQNNNQQTHSSIDDDDNLLDNYLSQDRKKTSSKIIQEVASSTIIESLTAEWWTLNLSQTVLNDLLENLIPLVVLACEKVINEADERHLIETTTSDRSFNPINRLASFLMRNNPKYIHYSSLSPYHYSMKSLLNTKKIQVLKIYGEEETLLRTILKQRQNERSQQYDTISKEEERRKNLLRTFFFDWNVPERGWIQTRLINNMIEQFNEISKQNDLKLNISPFQSHRMHLGAFTENFLNSLKNQSLENFDSIINTYRHYAQTYSNIVQEHELNLLLQRLFNKLDDKQSDYLLRQNVMKVLQTFYNALNDNDKQYVNQPNQWPVVKQTILNNEMESNETSSESETVQQEKPPGSPVTNEQQIVSSISADENIKIDEGQEQTNDEQKKINIELKHPSVYEAEFRFTNEHKPIYNLEHFDTIDHEKSIQFDEQLIDKIQFSALLISFCGLKKNEMVISALIDYFRSNYKETNEEKNAKKILMQQRLIDAEQRTQSDLVFEKMNTTCTGLIKLEPLANILKQYKEGAAIEQIEQVLQTYQDQKQLSSTQFYDLLINIHQTLNETMGGGENFDELLKYIDNQQPQINASDRTRIHTRHQWLKRIRNIPFRTLGYLYKEVMDIIQKDSETFSNQPSKHLSIYIALLENNRNQIRYVATTNDQTDLLLDKTLQRGEGISFQILDSGKWAYINQTKNHSSIKFFNPDDKNQSGSFVLIPLKRLQHTSSNGLLGIDTIQDKKEKAFAQHEVQFYEGVASALSDTFTFVDFDKNMMKILQRFTYWIEQRCSNVSIVDYYTYEPTSMNTPTERLLKHVFTYSNGNLTIFDTPKLVNSREQVFKYNLEHAAVSCQSTITSFLGQTHMIQAIRGRDNFCFSLIDTNIGEQEDLPNEQKQDLTTMYRCIYMAVDELEQELIDDTTKQFLTYEKQSDEMRLNYLFDRIWYMDICNKIKQLSSDTIHEFINNKSKWNDQIKQILSIISRLVKHKELNPTDYATILFPAMIEFDPTTKEHDQNDLWNRAEQLIKTIDQSIWQQPSSDVIKIFYDWLTLAYELEKLSKTQ